MYKIITTLLLVSCLQVSRGQSIEDFLFLRTSNIAEVNKALTDIDWYIYDEDEQRKNDIIVYTFKNNNDIESMLKVQWINYVHRPKHYNKNRLSFQVQNKDLFEQYTAEMIMLGFKYDYYKDIHDNTIIVYHNKDVAIEVITSKSKYMYDGGTYYNFAFYNKLEYDIVFEEEKIKNLQKEKPLTNIASINYFD